MKGFCRKAASVCTMPWRTNVSPVRTEASSSTSRMVVEAPSDAGDSALPDLSRCPLPDSPGFGASNRLVRALQRSRRKRTHRWKVDLRHGENHRNLTSARLLDLSGMLFRRHQPPSRTPQIDFTRCDSPTPTVGGESGSGQRDRSSNALSPGIGVELCQVKAETKDEDD